MGLFDKLKQNLTHGGIDLELQAPITVSSTETTIPVQIKLTSTSSQQAISRVYVEIISESHSLNFDANPSIANNRQQTTQVVAAMAENLEPFTLVAGESKIVQLTIVMNAGNATGDQLPQDGALAQVADAIGKVQAVAGALNPNSTSYIIKATADVEGVALDPSVSQPIQILGSGQFGIGFNAR